MTGTPTFTFHFGPDGLLPAVIVESATGSVLMVGFMNELALDRTRSTGLVHYWSRSRQQLWQKGETSGHIQEVVSISINCELNTLLIEVNQVGAVCHDGYPTCFYRQLEPDNSLTIMRDRWFDPADVYGEGTGIADLTRRWWGAYELLKSNDLEAFSGTSRLLRSAEDRITERIADELRELAGALDGSHRHVDLTSDVELEGGQVAYWVVLRCIRDGLAWEEVSPDRALEASGGVGDVAAGTIARLLQREADLWSSGTALDLAAFAHGTLSLVTGACVAAGVEPRMLIVADLNELRTRRYLEEYFASERAGKSE